MSVVFGGASRWECREDTNYGCGDQEITVRNG
jgi:hypothetical protein